jgi:glycosyltransferase involved in cell wall biosynthesis
MPERAASDQAQPRIAALVCLSGSPKAWLETLQTLSRLAAVSEIRLVADQDAHAAVVRAGLEVTRVDRGDFAQLSSALVSAGFDQILLVLSPIAAPLAMLDRASDWIVRDFRLATVSFLSNSAGHLSLPHRNTPVPYGIRGHDENSLTTTLRERKPDTGPVPIACPAGAAILISSLVLRHAAAGLRALDPDLGLAAAEFGVSVSAQGFINALDAGTYVTQPWEWATSPPPSGYSAGQIDRLSQHRPAFRNIYADDRESLVAPVAQALHLARAKAEGLRILIDGTCLGPQEMGTQLLVMALTKALRRRDDVSSICLAVPDPNNLPGYVQDVRSLSKISLVASNRLEFPGAPHVDIIHRPYQPDYPIPWKRWRELSGRSLITIQDLIAYRNGSYFATAEEWLGYRANLAEQVSQADGVVSISHDVVGSIREERLKVADRRLYVVENGIDYREPDGPKQVPAPILQRGWQDAPFLFVLGATYSHKNRDVAIRVWKALRQRGHVHKLVLAGANVPRGSTRQEEAELLVGEGDVLKLPDISGPERDWLMSQTSLVMYPTSAEGFGQLPFEAARFGKPALYVAFGPLAELIDDDGVPLTWDLEGLVDRAERLMTDEAAGREAAARALGKIDQLTWDVTAAKSVEAYLDLLGQIPNPG